MAKRSPGFFLESKEWLDFGGNLTGNLLSWQYCEALIGELSAIIPEHLQKEIPPPPRRLLSISQDLRQSRVIPGILLWISCFSLNCVLFIFLKDLLILERESTSTSGGRGKGRASSDSLMSTEPSCGAQSHHPWHPNQSWDQELDPQPTELPRRPCSFLLIMGEHLCETDIWTTQQRPTAFKSCQLHHWPSSQIPIIIGLWA